MRKKRIGIYAGTFDPVHAGHISFALQAKKVTKLDQVIFLPERRPRGGKAPEHFGHRTAMITRAIRPHSSLALLELPDINFSISKTLPKLKEIFCGAQLVLLLGSDAALSLLEWPDSDRLINQCELVIGLRRDTKVHKVLQALKGVKLSITIIKSARPHVSSHQIRKSLMMNEWARGLLPSVRRYAQKQWLYYSVNKI